MRQKVRSMPGRYTSKKSIGALPRFQSVDVEAGGSVRERRSPLGALPADNGVDIAEGILKLRVSGIDTTASRGAVSLASTKKQPAGEMNDMHAWRGTMTEVGGGHSPQRASVLGEHVKWAVEEDNEGDVKRKAAEKMVRTHDF